MKAATKVTLACRCCGRALTDTPINRRLGLGRACAAARGLESPEWRLLVDYSNALDQLGLKPPEVSLESLLDRLMEWLPAMDAPAPLGNYALRHWRAAELLADVHEIELPPAELLAQLLGGNCTDAK
jgi:hypothetical protein